jgi:hypothetical protein
LLVVVFSSALRGFSVFGNERGSKSQRGRSFFAQLSFFRARRKQTKKTRKRIRERSPTETIGACEGCVVPFTSVFHLRHFWDVAVAVCAELCASRHARAPAQNLPSDGSVHLSILPGKPFWKEKGVTNLTYAFVGGRGTLWRTGCPWVAFRFAVCRRARPSFRRARPWMSSPRYPPGSARVRSGRCRTGAPHPTRSCRNPSSSRRKNSSPAIHGRFPISRHRRCRASWTGASSRRLFRFPGTSTGLGSGARHV